MRLKIGSIQAKLDLIADYLNELEPLASLSMNEITAMFTSTERAERLQELIIQASLDIGRHLLKEQYQLDPRGKRQCFLGTCKAEYNPFRFGRVAGESCEF